MKHISFFLLSALFLASCGSSSSEYSLKGKVGGTLENGTKIFLKTNDSLNRVIEIDTVELNEGSFVFTGQQDIPQLHYIFIDDLPGSIPVILENGSIDVKFQKDSLAYATLSGTPQNESFMVYLKENRRMAAIGKTFNDDFRRASVAKDTVAISSLRDEYFELQDEIKTFEQNFVTENPDALISIFIIQKLMSTKVLSLQEVGELYNSLTDKIKATTRGKQIGEQLNKALASEVGSTAPEFSGPTPDGSQLALNDIKGKVTLVDFWAAWCKPCRQENPNVVAVYNKYHDQGFNVVGVSLDAKADAWKQAIADDGLTWNHISNLQRFQDPVAKMYNVNAIPAAFLIDENGVIVAKNLRGPALEQKVAELLGGTNP